MPASVRTSGLRSRSPRPEVVREAADTMLSALGLPRAEVSILLCDDDTIHQLNKDYRRKDKPTDVLAFALREGEAARFAGDMLGDVVISIDTARRQAAEHDRSLIDEVRFLLAHGMLHLVGYDHATKAEERRMMALTDALLGAELAGRGRRDQKAIRRRRS